jgi:cytochrome P450
VRNITRPIFAIAGAGASGRRTPGPRGVPLAGVLPRLKRDPLGLFGELARDYGDVVRIPAGPRRVYFLNHPDHVRHVLQVNHRNYRLPPSYRKLRPVFGAEIFTSEGGAWAWRRELMQPASGRRAVAGLLPVIAEATEEMLDRSEVVASRAEPVDVAEEAVALTLQVVARAMLGVDLGARARPASRAILLTLEGAVTRAMALTDEPPNRRSARRAG